MIKKLRQPVPSLDEKRSAYTELNVRDFITAGDIMAMRRHDGDAFEADCILIGRVTGLDAKEVASMDYQDVADLQEVCRAMMKRPDPPEEVDDAEADTPPKS